MGRGAVDAKGQAAAILEAVESLLASGFAPRVEGGLPPPAEVGVLRNLRSDAAHLAIRIRVLVKAAVVAIVLMGVIRSEVKLARCMSAVPPPESGIHHLLALPITVSASLPWLRTPPTRQSRWPWSARPGAASSSPPGPQLAPASAGAPQCHTRGLTMAMAGTTMAAPIAVVAGTNGAVCCSQQRRARSDLSRQRRSCARTGVRRAKSNHHVKCDASHSACRGVRITSLLL